MWARLLLLFGTLKADWRIWAQALRDRRRPRWLWPVTLALVAYVLFPIDLVPDFILGFGWLDDAALLAAIIHFCAQRLRARFPDTPVPQRR